MATLTVQLEQIGPSTMQASARTHAVLIDRPSAKGGADRGPLGGEYLLVALGGCFASNLLAAIRARDAAMTKLRAHIERSAASFTNNDDADNAVRRELLRLLGIIDQL